MSFENNADQATTTTPDNVTDTTPFLVVGDRVFQTAEDMVKAYTHSQSHISNLEDEAGKKDLLITNMDVRLQEAKTAEDILKQQTATATKPEATPPVNTDELVKQAIAGATSGVVQQLKDDATKEAEQVNMNTMMTEAKTLYGDNYAQVVLDLGAKEGLSKAQVDTLARQSPQAFRTLLLKTVQGSTEANIPITTTANFQGQAPAAGYTGKSFMKMTQAEKTQHIASRLADLET